MPRSAHSIFRHDARLSYNHEFHRQRAHRARNAYLRELAAAGVTALPTISPGVKRAAGAFAAALVVATLAFWTVMLVSPPQTEASTIGSAGRLETEAGYRCSIGSEVSNFVCRNTWMGHHQYSYR